MKSFENVMGYDSLKQELVEIIDIMQNKEAYKKLGANCPSGLLLYGPPGVGKTLIANSLIEASGRLAVICRKNASGQSFIDSINEAFLEAIEKAPSIILLDDMDKFANDDDDHKDSEAYVTIQSCIDTVKGSDVFVLATANNVRKLPDSLIRTGRFDRRIEVGKPSEEDSQKIIEHYLSGKDLGDEVDVKALSELFRGVSCSTLETIINQASIIAGYRRADRISMEDMVQSYLQVARDVPKEFLSPTGQLDLYAEDGSAGVIWHEAGHLVMSEILSPGSVTMAIASANEDAGHGFVAGKLAKPGMPLLEKIKARALISLASAAAIDIMFGRVDVGAQQDISEALNEIKGITENLGGFAGLSLITTGYSSEAMDSRREIVNSAIAELFYQEAKETLSKNRAFLIAVAESLAEHTILTASDILKIRADLEMSPAA